MEDAVGIVEVELIGSIVGRKITLRELIHVDKEITAQEVIHTQVVVIALDLVRKSCSEIDEIRKLRIQNGIEVEALGINNSILQHVQGATATDVVAGNAIGIGDGRIIGPVYIVQTLPVDLTEVDVCLHPIVQ